MQMHRRRPKKREKKYYKGCRAKKLRMRQIKKIPVVDGTFTKNIVFKEVLMPYVR
jgi:hypothetical protein